jgi:hypothetical protein
LASQNQVDSQEKIGNKVTPTSGRVEIADDTVDLLEVLRTGAVRGSFHRSLVRGSSWISKICGWRSVLLDRTNSDVC